MSLPLAPASDTGVDKGLPDASFMSSGSSFHAIYRFPHGRWSVLVDHRGEAYLYADAVSATRAGLAFVMGKLFRPILADRASDLQTMAEALGVEAWRRERAVQTRKIHRGDGKRPVVEERRRKVRPCGISPC